LGPLSLPVIWLISTVGAWVVIFLISGSVFYALFWAPTFELWQRKSNPLYPPPEKVAEEIRACLFGALVATIPPSITIWAAYHKYSKGYCNSDTIGWGYFFVSQIAFWLFVDCYEYLYHRAGHVYKRCWTLHKYHHTFHNPSPFAVIADEFTDQLFRALPMFLFPMIFPLNLEWMLLQMALTSYGYGCYIHCGHELSWPDAHHPIINTSYQHYAHHTISVYGKAYYCGFFLKVFDNLFGTVYQGKCFCAKCCRDEGKRSLEAWKNIVKPDYRVLLSPTFWWKQLFNGKV